MEIDPTPHHCMCGRCGTEFDIVSATGPSEICDACALPLFAILGITPMPTKPTVTRKPRNMFTNKEVDSNE